MRVIKFVLGEVLILSLSFFGTSALCQKVEEAWVARYNGSGNGPDEPHSLVVDAFGNVYVAGASFGSGTDYDYVTIKYDENGNEQWIVRYNGPGNGWDEAQALAVDSFGNVYVGGSSLGNGNGSDFATIKLDSNGNKLWVARYNGPADGWDWCRDLAVDGVGNVYVTGRSYGGSSNDDYATVKYDPSGNQLWVARHSWSGKLPNN